MIQTGNGMGKGKQKNGYKGTIVIIIEAIGLLVYILCKSAGDKKSGGLECVL